MIFKEGSIVLFSFPNTNNTSGKLRPALIIKNISGDYDDCLLSMISSKLFHKIDGFDELINKSDNDFHYSGLKVDSLIRISRLAVVEDSIIQGKIGEISSERLLRIKASLSNWISKTN